MRWVEKTGVNFFDWVFRLADPVEKVAFFDWIRQSEFSIEKSLSRKSLFSTVEPDLGFSRKRPFSADKSDCIRNGLRLSLRSKHFHT